MHRIQKEKGDNVYNSLLFFGSDLFIQIHLREYGFDEFETVVKTTTLKDFEGALQSQKFDLIIIGEDSSSATAPMDLIRAVRRKDTNTPILLLLARDDKVVNEQFLRAGATDIFITLISNVPGFGKKISKVIRTSKEITA